jgi:hypothetical protein
MRITDDRYTRDRQRFDLALRMIRHEARTCTIRTWTGLTDDRIRKLYRSYVAEQGPPVKRRRGKSPSHVGYFLKNLEARRHASALASLYTILGLLPTAAMHARLGAPGSLQWGERFCQTYETYLELHGPHRMSFERACALWHALKSRSELRPGPCPACGGLMVVDTLRTQDAQCALCEREKRSGDPG